MTTRRCLKEDPVTTCRTLTSDFRPFRRLSWRWSPAATKTPSLSVTAVTSGSFFYVWQARVFPPSTLPGVDVALLVGSLSCLPSLPPSSRLSSEDHPMDTEVQTEGASSSAIPLVPPHLYEASQVTEPHSLLCQKCGHPLEDHPQAGAGL